jgi:hypothetical protein
MAGTKSFAANVVVGAFSSMNSKAKEKGSNKAKHWNLEGKRRECECVNMDMDGVEKNEWMEENNLP